MRPLSNTVFIGKELQYIKQVDSTNAYLQRLLTKFTPPEGLMVFADNQFKGRGQVETKWLSNTGENILTSILLYPKFLSPRHLFYFNKATALSVHHFVAQYLDDENSHHIKIKWPNDIYADDKKIAGILIETSCNAQAVLHTVTGLGININHIKFSPDIPNPTSLRLLTDTNYDLQNLIEDLCVQIEEHYFLLRASNFKKIDEEYHKQLYKINEECVFCKDGNYFTAMVCGVNEYGKLLLETDGKVREFAVKEVGWVDMR